MSTLRLKRGQTATVPFTVLNNVNTPYNLTGFTVRLVVAGNAGRVEKTGTVNSPATLGTGSFGFAVADYAVLRPGSYTYEVWLTTAVLREPVLSGVLEVSDVPQVST